MTAALVFDDQCMEQQTKCDSECMSDLDILESC